ncbi:MAG: SDR family oxidoreductase [Deltaproteobacteria bacterium]|nr:SDR family oxidoreductase [Deltaproteobacteria bacterium]MBW1950775.1 SDR family oxidoreductase [Deltaproteobacteria bacterium]MBW2009091.1 SDR family oxidoreductase [Deltaproteobacteria bacterium]MBW2349109.1 SDR family oxidoreductase [Deltaproteobacteria bacterium]
MRLKGKTALVTGAARGIGRATARVLAREGAHVGVADILPEVEKTAKEMANAGAKAAAAVFDISDPLKVREGVAEIQEALGPIDILVNNAGIVNNIAPLKLMRSEAWEREISVNLSGAFHMIQALIGPMVERRWGRIINISSGAATGGLHRQAGYAASKAGLLGLTMTVTLEHARDGITCNAILPGLIETELVREMPEEILKASLAAIPSRRLGKTEEIGRLVAFLASDEAAYINGAAIPVDGGMTLNTGSLGSRKEILERPGGRRTVTCDHGPQGL